MSWDPKLHPRLPAGHDGGEFTHAEGWIHQLSSAIGAPDRKPIVHGRDRVTASDGKSANRFPAGRLQEHWKAMGTRAEFDDRLDMIYDMQGYHTKPTVVSGDELRHLVDREGWKEVWRGVGKLLGDSPARYAEDFRTGEKHYAGIGYHGNGTYTSTDKDDAYDYTSDPSVGILHIAISPDARIAEYGEGPVWDDYMKSLEFTPDQTEPTDTQRVLGDFGRYAALRGFDAVVSPGGYSRSYGPPGTAPYDHYIILNRGVVAVERAKPVQSKHPFDALPAPQMNGPGVPEYMKGAKLTTARELGTNAALRNTVEYFDDDDQQWAEAGTIKWAADIPPSVTVMIRKRP